MFVVIGGMIVLALSVALVGPYFVDWTNYRADFEREASRILGRDVEVRGAATARLLPFPSVSFTDVVVTGSRGETVMTVETFSMDAELAPFLSGEVLIFDMRLQRPEVFVTIDEDGMPDWAVRQDAPIDLRHVTVESMSVADGRINLRHRAAEREHVFSDINAQLSARTLAGPWRATGDMRIDGVETSVLVTTGVAEPGGALRMRMRAQPHAAPISFETEGEAAIDDAGRLSYAGQFRLAAHAALARAANGVSEGPPDYRVSGRFAANHERLVAEEFRFETGPLEDPYTADGHAMISIGVEPRFYIAAEGVQLRVDEAEGGVARLEDRIAALRQFVARLPRPAIPGSVQLDLPAVVAGDTTIREVRVRAEPSVAGWHIAALNATLPGRTVMEASGELTVGEELGFAGSLLLAVNQPSGFASWLSRDVDEAIRRLPAAGFSAEVELGERRQSFRDLELVLGTSVFRGEADNRQPEGLRPSMSLQLEGDGLDVEGMSAFASLFVSGQGENRLEDHDLDFDIRADDVSLAGMSADRVDTALRLRQGQLEIDRLMINGLAGADVSATGSVRDLSGTPKGRIDATVIAIDLAPLARTLAERLPDNRPLAELVRRADAHPGLLEDAELTFLVNAAGGSDGGVDLSVNAEGSAGGSDFDLALASRDWSGELVTSPISARLSARSQDSADLHGLVGLPGELRGFAGPATGELTVEGVLELGATTRLTLTGEDMRAGFEGETRLSGERFAAKGRGTIRGGDLMPWLMTAAVPVPGMDSSLPIDLRADLDYSAGLLVLSGLEGELARTRVRGELNAETRDGLPHLTGELYVQAMDLSLATELLFGPDAHIGNGRAMPDQPFRASVAVPFTTDLDLVAEEATFGNAFRLEDLSTAARLTPDGFSVSNLSGEIDGGRLTGLGELRNDAGEGLFSAQLRLEDADVRRLLPATGIEGRARLAASLSSTGKSFGAMVAALAGSGTASIGDLVIAGVAPDALEDLLAAADRVGRDVGPAEAEAFAPRIVRAGRFPAGDVEFAFTVAGGVMRVPPIHMEAAGARMSAEFSLDLNALVANAEATIQYDAGSEALVGSEPAVRLLARGPLHDISVATDTEPLARFLTQRALEQEQQRVEDMQAGLLEQQRMRREVRYFAALRQERIDREEERRRAEEEAQRQFEDEARRRAEAAAQRRLEEERRLAEEEARRIAEEEARQSAQEEAEIRLEQERRRVEEARRRAEEEARVEEERRQRLESEIENILRQRELRMDDLDDARRTPLPPPQQIPAEAEQEGAASEIRRPGVYSIFQPQNLTPEGLSRLTEGN